MMGVTFPGVREKSTSEGGATLRRSLQLPESVKTDTEGLRERGGEGGK